MQSDLFGGGGGGCWGGVLGSGRGWGRVGTFKTLFPFPLYLMIKSGVERNKLQEEFNGI